MGNCCCVLRNGDKKFKSGQRPDSKRCKKTKNYYKYGDDEYDNDDYDDSTIDYDRQTTKSDLSSAQTRSKNSFIESKKQRPNRLIDKAILNQHLKQQQNNQQLSSSSSSTILLLKQSHLIQPSTSNLDKNFNIELNSKISDFTNKKNSNILLLNHTESYNLALNKIKSCESLSNRAKRWSIVSADLIENITNINENKDNKEADNLKPLLSEFYKNYSDDDGVDVGDDDNFDDTSSKLTDSNNQQDLKDRLTDNNSSSDQLILNSVSSTVITTSKSSYNETTPKMVQSCHSMKSSSIDDLTSNSNSLTRELDDLEPRNKRRLVYQKRNSNLNHSLNETDLVINNKMKQTNKKRKLKQRKIDLDDENNKTYIENEEYNSDDAISDKLKKNYLNYRSLQKSKRSIKNIEQTIKNSKSIEKWLNDFDKIKELDQPSIPESPQTTIQRADSTPNEDLYSLFDERDDSLSKKIIDSVPKNLCDLIESLIEINSRARIKHAENDMFNYIRKFVLPKSLANADDINFLKLFLNEKNFTLLIEQPVLSKTSSNFILECKNIKIDLVEASECDNQQDLEDQCYLKYVVDKQILLLDQEKVKYILNKEKELSQATNLNNQGILASFREQYIETNNFNAVQSLMNICKKSNSLKKSNLSSNSCSSSSTTSTPILNTSQTETLIPIQFSDLNDKLFLCFLSNFSCKLVDYFLQFTNNQSQLYTAGFIRKHKIDKSFSYVFNENELKSNNFKLFLKLNKWPKTYDFINRLKFIKSSLLIDYISKQTCLITNYGFKDELEMSLDFDENEKWTIDTRLVETIIFKSFNKLQLFSYYYLTNVLNNLKSIIEGAHGLVKHKDEFYIDNRVLLHHYLRFMHLNPDALKNESTKLFVQFSEFLRLTIQKHNSLNLPNFFDLKQEILIELPIDSKLSEFVDLLNKGEVYFKKASKPIDLMSMQFRQVTNVQQNKIFNEYLTDFFQILFEQFKSKRDHFKINEQVLIEIHEKVVQSNENLNSILNSNEHQIDISSALLSKFEMYAECVHKYLPQIRQHNQYLLFHYIWTMQVQYLAPFFNYICDMYKSYN